MSEGTDPKDVAGVFDNEEAAAAAVDKLIFENFGACNELSVLVSKDEARKAVRIWEPVPAYRASALGAALGAALAGIGVAIAGIGFGPFTLIEWGPLWAVFEAAYVGGAVGMTLGALMSFEMTHPKVEFGPAGTHDGVIWVSLRAGGARAERARAILAEAGARHMMERQEAVGRFDFSHAA